MKLKVVFLLIGLVLGCFSYGQIKIGDQPQNIDPASVLELQSTSRALVLTRVNNTQMNAIRPLQGALVYNTETKCVHYYEGTQWLNICDALTNSVNISMVDNGDGSYTFTDAVGVETIITTTTNTTFEVANDSLVLTDSNNNTLSVALDSLNRHTYSSDAVVNLPASDSTIVITKTANNYNFEVGEITGLNILDRSITREDIAGTAINGDFHIQNRSTPVLKLVPGTNGQLLQTQTVTGQPTVVWVNKAGLFTAAEVSYDPTVSGLTATTVKLAIDEISTSSNSLTIGDILTQGNDAGAQLIRNVLDPSSAQDVATRNYVDTQVSNSNILADANIFVGDAAGTAQAVPVSGDATMDNTGALTISDNAVTSSKILDGTIDSVDIAPFSIGTPQLSNNSVTSVKILDGEVSTADIANDAIDNSKIADNAVQVENILNGTANQVLKTNAAGTLVEWGTLNSNNITGQDLSASDTSITVTGGFGTTLATTSLAVSNLGITNDKIAPDAVDNAKIDDNAIQTENILDGEVTTADIANDAIDNSKIADNAVQVENILNGTANQVLKTNAAGSLVEWGTLDPSNISGQDLTADDSSITVTGGIGTTLATTSLAVTALGITNDKIAPNAVDNAKIADNAVQVENILNGTANQVLKTNAVGTLVEWGTLNSNNITGQDLTADDTSITVTGGTGTTLVTTGLAVSNLGITNAKMAADAVDNTKIADNAVQTENILDGEVSTADIANDAIDNSKIADNAVQVENILNGTANQVLKTNAAGSLVEWGTLDPSNISGQDLTADDSSITVTGGIGTTLATTSLAVTALGITNDKIAPNAVDNAKIADNAVQVENILNGTANQVLKTNAAGTLVEWGTLNSNNITGQDLTADDTSITVTGGIGTTLATTSLAVSNLGITNDKIAPDAVDNTKIDDNAIQTENILDGEVTTADIANDAIDNSKIADNAVQVENILNGTANQVLKTNAAGSLVEWGTLDPSNISGQDLTADDSSITVTGGIGTTLATTSLAVTALGITNAKLAADAVDNTKITDNAIQTENILNANVTPIKIEPSSTNGQVLKTQGVTVAWANQFHAIAKMIAEVPTNATNINTVEDLGLGNYRVNFSNAASSPDYVIQLTLLNAGADVSIEVTEQTNSNFTVQISQISVTSTADNSTPPIITSTITSTPVDAAWYFTVTDF